MAQTANNHKALGDRDTVADHLEYMFGSLRDHPKFKAGFVEIGDMKTARHFRLTELDNAADYVMRRSAKGKKTYVHAGLIKPTGDKVRMSLAGEISSHSKGADVMCWPLLWGEADHAHLNFNRDLTGDARNAARLAAFQKGATDHGIKWGWLHSTGTVPTIRLQGFARLAEPAAPDDPKFWQVLKSISHNAKLDQAATNSSQLLRVGGSISPAPGVVKKGEENEAPRITETVRLVSRAPGVVDLADIHNFLDEIGSLLDVKAPEATASAKDIAALLAKVAAPENPPPFDRDRVRAYVRKIVLDAADPDENGPGTGRRDMILRCAKTIGGLLWTGHFQPDEIISDEWADELDDDPGLSLALAYEANGGTDDNGRNGIEKGILDAMATGTSAPLRVLPLKASDDPGALFGAVEDEDEDEIAPPEKRSLGLSIDNMHGDALAIEKRLRECNVEMFRRGGDLVRVAKEDLLSGVTSAALVRVTPVYLQGVVSQHMRVHMRGRKGPVSIKPPIDVMRLVVERADETGFPTIAGIIGTPTLRPDGSLLTAPGYDQTTRTYLLDGLALPDIPEKPTRQDALNALALLKGLLDEFCFVDRVGLSVALSAILSVVLRQMFRVVPAHFSIAPAAGSGKSYLWDVVSVIAMGERAPAQDVGNREEELNKRLDGSLLSGHPIICLDNVNGQLKSDLLCQVIERPIVEVRALGRSDKYRIVNKTVVLGSGINTEIVNDLTRRVLVASLDPQTERPELRTYEKRPTEIVTDARGLYVAACLTIVRAYRAALERGEAKSVSPKLASFEDWSDNVRSALVWLGEADPVESMTQARENDPALAARRAIVSAWAAICGAEAMTIADAVEQSDRARLNCDDDLDDPMPDLKAILMEHAGTVGGKFDNRRAGSFLRTIAGAVVDGRRLVKVKSRDTSKPVMWRVETVTK